MRSKPEKGSADCLTPRHLIFTAGAKAKPLYFERALWKAPGAPCVPFCGASNLPWAPSKDQPGWNPPAAWGALGTGTPQIC